MSREKAARVATSGLVYPTLGYPARGPASWHRSSESSIITDSAGVWFHGSIKLCAVQHALRLDGPEPSWPGGVSSAPVRREDGNGRERHLSVSAQSCRNRGSRVQFCPGRVDCHSCLALAAQVNGGKKSPGLMTGHFLCRLVAPAQCCPRETPRAVALGRRGWPWLGASYNNQPGAMMRNLTFTCPQTGRAIDSGVHTDVHIRGMTHQLPINSGCLASPLYKWNGPAN